MATTAAAELSPLDEDRFGVRTAKARPTTPDEVRTALEFCHDRQVRLLIARCPTVELTTAHALEAAGGQVMDVLVYYRFDFNRVAMPTDDSPLACRLARPEDALAVATIARPMFKGYAGHYHADPRLDPSACDEVYASWAERSCRSRDVADAVILLTQGEAMLAFAALRLTGAEEAESVLGGVAVGAQKRGLYRVLFVRELEWCRAQRVRYLVISTQIGNVAVQKVWSRLGLEPAHSYLTFHVWLPG
jgi:hypothetical protein